jgi:hypothetical protein
MTRAGKAYLKEPDSKYFRICSYSVLPLQPKANVECRHFPLAFYSCVPEKLLLFKARIQPVGHGLLFLIVREWGSDQPGMHNTCSMYSNVN